MLRRRILASAMASVMALGSVAVVANAEETAVKAVKTKADLEAYIASFEDFRSDELYDYGSISGENFLNALEYADNVLADEKSTVDDYTAAYAMIEAVYNRLTIYTAEELKALVDSCTAIYEQNNVLNEELGDIIYKEDKFTAFAGAYEEADAVLDSADARIITDAYEVLADAKKNLETCPVVTKAQFRTALKAYETALQKEFKYDTWRVGTINTGWSMWYVEGATVAYGTLYEHVASLEGYISGKYAELDEIKSVNKTTRSDITDAYNACMNATKLLGFFTPDDTNRATKANVKSLLKEYNGRLVYDYARTSAEDLFDAVVEAAGGVKFVTGDKYSSDLVDFDAENQDAEDAWYVISDKVSIKPNPQDKYSAKVEKLISAELSVKPNNSVYLALDKDGYAVGVAKTKEAALKVETGNYVYAQQTDSSIGMNGWIYEDAAGNEYINIEDNGLYANTGSWDGSWQASAADAAAKIEELGLTQVIAETEYASTAKLLNKAVVTDLTDYVKVTADDITTNTDNHIWNNVVDGDAIDVDLPAFVTEAKGFGKDVIQIGGGNAWDTISTEAPQNMDGSWNGYTTFADLAEAYALAESYIANTKGDTAILAIDSTNSLDEKTVKGSSAEWTMVYRYLKYALADKYDASFGTHTKAEVEDLIEKCYDLADLTGDAALFAANHNALVTARQDALDWIKLANKEKKYKDNVTVCDGLIATQVYDALWGKYEALLKDYNAFKYSFEEIYNKIAEVADMIDAGDLEKTPALVKALDDCAYTLSIVKPVVDSVAGDEVAENYAFTSDRFFQGYNRVFTNGGEYDSLKLVDETSVKIAKAFGDGSYGANGSHYDLQMAYEALLAEIAKQTEVTVLKGDVDGNGAVNVLDASALLINLVNGVAMDAAVADYDANGAVNVLDASAILVALVNA